MGIGATPETVRLSNAMWTIEIVPQSLAINTYPASSETAVPISSGQSGFGTATDFTQKGNSVSWKVPEQFLNVHIELLKDSLTVEFIQDGTDKRSLTWPLIEDTESLRGYIFPFFEGSYVPKNDGIWQEFLYEQGPINTTAGLSMPFWGLDLGERTLTYILTNPFNNKILFSKTDTSALGMQVSHTFTPNWEEKKYGLRISLGRRSTRRTCQTVPTLVAAER